MKDCRDYRYKTDYELRDIERDHRYASRDEEGRCAYNCAKDELQRRDDELQEERGQEERREQRRDSARREEAEQEAYYMQQSYEQEIEQQYNDMITIEQPETK